jgi:hypothetical protein
MANADISADSPARPDIPSDVFPSRQNGVGAAF